MYLARQVDGGNLQVTEIDGHIVVRGVKDPVERAPAVWRFRPVLGHADGRGRPSPLCGHGWASVHHSASDAIAAIEWARLDER